MTLPASLMVVLALAALSCTGGGPTQRSGQPTPNASRPDLEFRAVGSPPPPGRRCPTPSRREGAYEVLIGPTAGRPGTRVTVGGNTPLFDKAGRYLGPSGKIGFWFNLPPGGWEHVYFGGSRPHTFQRVPVIHLGEVDVSGRCSYRASFRVPEVPAGTYSIVPIEHGAHGAAAFASIEFRVA
jgi:hypothetical protein